MSDFKRGDRVRIIDTEHLAYGREGVVKGITMHGVEVELRSPSDPTRAEYWTCRVVDLEHVQETYPPLPDDTMRLPVDSTERKQIPLVGGLLNYFPDALVAVARISKKGNEKHNPGKPLHWSRDKSTDHLECIARHLIDWDKIDPDDGEYHIDHLIWRACAQSQLLKEAHGAKKAPGAR